jgi:hypothetical protein
MQGAMDPDDDPFVYEPIFYHWFTQYNPSEWEPWLRDLPDYQYTEHWTKLAWVNWYFQCRQRRRYLDILEIGCGIEGIVFDDGEKTCRRRFSPY